MADNAGVEGSVIVEKVRETEFNVGYNAATDQYEDMIAAGIIDPAKVVRSALQNAGSIAGMVLTTEALVARRRHGWHGRHGHGRHGRHDVIPDPLFLLSDYTGGRFMA